MSDRETVEDWVKRSRHNKQKLEVVIQNREANEEVVTSVNPEFAAGVSGEAFLRKIK